MFKFFNTFAKNIIKTNIKIEKRFDNFFLQIIND